MAFLAVLQDEPYDFLASRLNGQTIAMNLSRPSLEEFFLQQLQQKSK